MNDLVNLVDSKKQTISARALHEALEVETRFDKWFNRMVEYGFEEKIDFRAVALKRPTAQGNLTRYTDYAISVEMAKHLCMIQRTEIGMRIRKYFIKVEQEWRDFKQTRQKSIDARNNFTDTLKAHGYTQPHEYIQTTVQMKKPFGITTKKDQMSKRELTLITAAEYAATALLEDEQGYAQVNPICVEASNAMANLLLKRISA